MPASDSDCILGIDVGASRIGVARSLLSVGMPNPLTTLAEPDNFLADIARLVKSEHATAVVVGVPRGMDGQETAQTRTVRIFIDQLTETLKVPVLETDEAATSVAAETELKARRKPYSKGDIDALAATFILEGFLREKGEIEHVR